jgi:hypothetical protein
MAQKEEFQIIYDGSTLQNHEMDVRDLAPALLAVGDLLEETNKTIYGDVAKVNVNVKGSFKTGCFQVDFTLVQTLSSQINAFLNTREGVSTVALLSILGLNAINSFGLLPFIAWVKNRNIKKITKIGHGKSTVEIDDEKKEVEDKVIDLYRNIKVRKSIEIIIYQPLQVQGVDKFAVKYKKDIFTVKDEQKDYYKTPEIKDEPLGDETRQVFLTALSISFVDDNKWRFSDGNVSFFASVKDETFLKQIQENRDGFFKDDIFEVKLREKQWLSDTGIKTEYEVVKVLNHRSAAKQIKLPFE